MSDDAALKAWRRRHDVTTRDALWSAACWEAAGNVDQAATIADAAVNCRDDLCSHCGSECLWWREWRERRARERKQERGGAADRWERLATENIAKRRATNREPVA